MNTICHRLFGAGFVRAMVVIVSIAIVFAGLAMAAGSRTVHVAGVVSSETVITAIGKDCHEPASQKSADHQTHMACGSGMNCFVLAAGERAVPFTFARQSGFAVRVAVELASRIIVPPSPPPKSIIVA